MSVLGDIIQPSIAPQEGDASPTRFGHHLIYSGKKFEDMVRWYRTLINGDVVVGDEAPSPELLARDDVDTIVIVKKPAVEQDEGPYRTGIFHIAWSYASLAELMTVYRYARDNGILPQSVLNTGILLQFYYVDPEGNYLEFEVDAHDTSKATQEAQRSGKREAELKHWIYDPEVILKMMEAGWSDYDILRHDTYHAGKAEFA